MEGAVPFRDDAEAARERIELLERENARRRVELDLARRRNTELAALREQLTRVTAERDWWASDASWSPRVRRVVIGVLVSSWFGLVATTAVAHTFRMRANAAIEREARTSERLDDLADLQQAARHDLAPTAPAPPSPTPFATVMRARIVRADGSSWAEPGDACVLAVAHDSALTPCRASLHCVGRELWSPDLECEMSMATMPPRLLRARADSARLPSIRFDRATRTLEVRTSRAEPPVLAEVVAITPFDMP
jgi:hypothetical protein